MTTQPELRATEFKTSWDHFVPRGMMRLDLQLTGVCDESLERYLYEGFLAGKRYTFVMIEVGGPVPKAVPGGVFTFAPTTYRAESSHSPVYGMNEGWRGFVQDSTKTVFR